MPRYGSLDESLSRRKRIDERGIPSVVARRRARLGFVSPVGVFLALTAGVGLAVRFGAPRGLLLVALVAAFVSPFVPTLCRETGLLLTEHGPRRSLLTASTPTGPRTVDLANLVRVGRYFLPGRFGKYFDLIIVTDTHGVRIGLGSAAGHALLKQALAAAGPQPPKPHVTGWAQRRLNSRLSWDVIVPLALSLAWSLVVFLLCLAIALS
jgi:hypothetical protein